LISALTEGKWSLIEVLGLDGEKEFEPIAKCCFMLIDDTIILIACFWLLCLAMTMFLQ
jgi:hypothetical protein